MYLSLITDKRRSFLCCGVNFLKSRLNQSLYLKRLYNLLSAVMCWKPVCCLTAQLQPQSSRRQIRTLLSPKRPARLPTRRRLRRHLSLIVVVMRARMLAIRVQPPRIPQLTVIRLTVTQRQVPLQMAAMLRQSRGQPYTKKWCLSIPRWRVIRRWLPTFRPGWKSYYWTAAKMV